MDHNENVFRRWMFSESIVPNKIETIQVISL